MSAPFTPTVPDSYWALVYLTTLPTVICLIWSFYSSDQIFAPASLRFHLAMDTLALGCMIPAIRLIRDLHPLVNTHAKHTNKALACESQGFVHKKRKKVRFLTHLLISLPFFSGQ